MYQDGGATLSQVRSMFNGDCQDQPRMACVVCSQRRVYSKLSSTIDWAFLGSHENPGHQDQVPKHHTRNASILLDINEIDEIHELNRNLFVVS